MFLSLVILLVGMVIYSSYSCNDPLSSGLNDPNHRYIIFRTHDSGNHLLPPYGVRTEFPAFLC